MLAKARRLSSACLTSLGSRAARAAKRTGDDRHQQSLGLLLGFAAELCPKRCEGEPVQHCGHAARAENQLRGLDAGQVRLQDLERIRADLVEPGIEPIPPLRRIDSGARHYAD